MKKFFFVFLLFLGCFFVLGTSSSKPPQNPTGQPGGEQGEYAEEGYDEDGEPYPPNAQERDGVREDHGEKSSSWEADGQEREAGTIDNPVDVSRLPDDPEPARRVGSTGRVPPPAPGPEDSSPRKTDSNTPKRSVKGAYRECSIFNGQVSSCGGWYKGKAVVYHDGAYRECSIFNGQISSCGGWYKGKAVVYHDGAYRECSVFNGRVSSCGTWYKGSAVIFRRQ